MSNVIYDFELTINPGETPQVRSRVLDFDGNRYTQSSFNSPGSITHKVIRLSDGETIREETLTVASVVFNSYQTWTEDSTGYNFKHTGVAADTDDEGVSYEKRYTFTDSAGNVSILRGKITTRVVP